MCGPLFQNGAGQESQPWTQLAAMSHQQKRGKQHRPRSPGREKSLNQPRNWHRERQKSQSSSQDMKENNQVRHQRTRESSHSGYSVLLPADSKALQMTFKGTLWIVRKGNWRDRKGEWWMTLKLNHVRRRESMLFGPRVKITTSGKQQSKKEDSTPSNTYRSTER